MSFLFINLVYAEPSYGGLIGRCFETPSEDSRCVFGWLSRTVKQESGHKRKAVGYSGSSKVELDTTAEKATKFNSTLTPDARDPNILYNYVNEINSLDSSGTINMECNGSWKRCWI